MVKNNINRICKMRVFRICVLAVVMFAMSLNMATSASAVSAVEGEQRFHAPIGGYVELISNRLESHGGGHFVTSVNLPRNFPALKHYGEDYILELSRQFYDYSYGIEGTNGDTGMYVHNFAKRVERLTYDNYTYDRIINYYVTRKNVYDEHTLDRVVFHFDPFAFKFNPNFLHNLIRFRVFDDFNFDWILKFKGTVWYVDSTNKLVSYPFDWTLECGKGHVAFTQGIFTTNYINHLVQKCGLSLGQPMMLTDMTLEAHMDNFGLDVYPQFTQFGYDILTENYVGGTPTLARDAVVWFNHQIKSDLNKAEVQIAAGSLVPPCNGTHVESQPATLLTTTFTEFLIDAATGFFEAELIPGITMGGIFVTVLIMAVVVGIIKLFL